MAAILVGYPAYLAAFRLGRPPGNDVAPASIEAFAAPPSSGGSRKARRHWLAIPAVIPKLVRKFHRTNELDGATLRTGAVAPRRSIGGSSSTATARSDADFGSIHRTPPPSPTRRFRGRLPGPRRIPQRAARALRRPGDLDPAFPSEPSWPSGSRRWAYSPRPRRRGPAGAAGEPPRASLKRQLRWIEVYWILVRKLPGDRCGG